MKVYKLEVMVIDFYGLGTDGVKETIENQKYPNYCISPSVMGVEARDVDWDDGHPLNNVSTQESAYRDLFGPEVPDVPDVEG